PAARSVATRVLVRRADVQLLHQGGGVGRVIRPKDRGSVGAARARRRENRRRRVPRAPGSGHGSRATDGRRARRSPPTCRFTFSVKQTRRCGRERELGTASRAGGVSDGLRGGPPPGGAPRSAPGG